MKDKSMIEQSKAATAIAKHALTDKQRKLDSVVTESQEE